MTATAELDPLDRLEREHAAPRLRDRVRLAVRLAAGRAVVEYRRAKAWQPHKFAPAAIGVGLISAAAALKFGVWAGLAVSGYFWLRLDARL